MKQAPTCKVQEHLQAAGLGAEMVGNGLLANSPSVAPLLFHSCGLTVPGTARHDAQEQSKPAHLQAALPVPVEVALDAAGVPLLHNLDCGAGGGDTAGQW